MSESSSNLTELSELTLSNESLGVGLYQSLTDRGFTLAAQDDRLIVSPGHLLSDRDVETIRANKAALIEHLAGNDFSLDSELSEFSELSPPHDPETWPGEITPELEVLLKPDWFIHPVPAHLLSDAECKALSLRSVLTGKRYSVQPTPSAYLPRCQGEETMPGHTNWSDVVGDIASSTELGNSEVL